MKKILFVFLLTFLLLTNLVNKQIYAEDYKEVDATNVNECYDIVPLHRETADE